MMDGNDLRGVRIGDVLQVYHQDGDRDMGTVVVQRLERDSFIDSSYRFGYDGFRDTNPPGETGFRCYARLIVKKQ